MIIGLDSATADFTGKFADEGILPNLKMLIDGGVWERLFVLSRV